MSNPSHQDAGVARPPPVPLQARTTAGNPNRSVNSLLNNRNRNIAATPIPPSLQAKMAAVSARCSHRFLSSSHLPSLSPSPLPHSSTFPTPSLRVALLAVPFPSTRRRLPSGMLVFQTGPSQRRRNRLSAPRHLLLHSDALALPPSEAWLLAAWARTCRGSAGWTWVCRTLVWGVAGRTKRTSLQDACRPAPFRPHSLTSAR